MASHTTTINKLNKDSGWVQIRTGMFYRLKDNLVVWIFDSVTISKAAGVAKVLTLPTAIKPAKPYSPFVRSGTTLITSWFSGADFYIDSAANPTIGGFGVWFV